MKNKIRNYSKGSANAGLLIKAVSVKVFKKVRAGNKAEAKQIAMNRQLQFNRRLTKAGYIIGDIDVFDAVES